MKGNNRAKLVTSLIKAEGRNTFAVFGLYDNVDNDLMVCM